MTFNEEIVAMQARLAKAEAERDTWRMSGMQQKYLGAHSAVEALELQLEALRQQGLRNMARAEAVAPAPAVRTQSAASELVETPDESGRELMAAHGITFRDGVYWLGEYRYDRLADAVNYARLRRLHARPAPPAS